MPEFANIAGWPFLLFQQRDGVALWGYDHVGQRFLYAETEKGEKPGNVIVDAFGYSTPAKIPTFRPPFRAAAITVTGHCNLNCDYCFVYPSPEKRRMPVELGRIIPRALKPHMTDGPIQLYMWGGEPTQNPEVLFAVLDAVRQDLGPRCTVMLTTNGCVTPDIVRRLCTYENLVFQISFDGPRDIQDRQKKLDGGGSYDLVTTTIALCNDLGKIPILRLTATRDNVEVLPEIFHFIIAQRLTNRICIEPVHTYVGRSTSQSGQQPGCDDYVDRLFECIGIAEDYGATVYSQPLKPLTYAHPYDWGFANVLPDGKVVSTVSVIDSSHPDAAVFDLGRISQDAAFTPSEGMERQERAYRRAVAKQCVACPVFRLCVGNEQKDYFAARIGPADYRCEVFRRIMKVWMQAMRKKTAPHIRTGSLPGAQTFQLVKRKAKILECESIHPQREV